jgi:hypothetical protein
MTRTNKLTLVGGSIAVIGSSHLIIRSIQRKKLFNQIAEKIGPGATGSLDQYDGWWSTEFWKKGNNGAGEKNYILQGDSTLMNWANSIYNSVGTFNDNEQTMYGVIRNVPDGVALSQLSDKFQNKWNRDLKDYVSNHFGEKEEKQKLLLILSQKPAYRVTG